MRGDKGDLLRNRRSEQRRIGLSIKAANYNEDDMRKEAAAFDTAIKPGEDLVGLDQAFASAFEDYRPGQK